MGPQKKLGSGLRECQPHQLAMHISRGLGSGKGRRHRPQMIGRDSGNVLGARHCREALNTSASSSSKTRNEIRTWEDWRKLAIIMDTNRRKMIAEKVSFVPIFTRIRMTHGAHQFSVSNVDRKFTPPQHQENLRPLPLPFRVQGAQITPSSGSVTRRGRYVHEKEKQMETSRKYDHHKGWPGSPTRRSQCMGPHKLGKKANYCP